MSPYYSTVTVVDHIWKCVLQVSGREELGLTKQVFREKPQKVLRHTFIFYNRNTRRNFEQEPKEIR